MSTTITRSTDAASIIPELVLNGWDSTDEPRTIVHEILGRETPDVTLRPAAPRSGTLRLLFPDAASAEVARKFHRAAAVFTTVSTLAWVPAAYVPAGGIRTAQQEGRRWVLEVPFQEVAP
ncbi:MAG: hypothetical protein BGN97_04480 [Microbacterium sp. 69-10]|uniref:hypothetical protein n=1 Tax=Microbacterium sp. 69-10 TaxID=1895783 RepID=UPI0009647E0B|nr:hypothetical protein [Microbacterium sp. 69-10]OJU42016.1 MAG: hypothetical protein BGN97_04480 [Microbacterium sp. 69-10]